MNSTRDLWADALSETWQEARHRLLAARSTVCRVVVIPRRAQRERELMVFQYGVGARRAGLAESTEQARG